jgi:hypothetical protein
LFAPWTIELWLEAVRNNGDLIEYLPYRSENKDIFLEALRSKGKALRHLYPGERTQDLSLEAVKSDGEELKFVPEKSKTLEICVAAFQNNPAAIEYSPFAKEVLLEELSNPQMTALMSIEKGIGKSYLPYTDSDIQALMNSACGWYCSAFLYWINKFDGRSQDLYSDTEAFIELFDDLNKSNNFKKNEFIL